MRYQYLSLQDGYSDMFIYNQVFKKIKLARYLGNRKIQGILPLDWYWGNGKACRQILIGKE